MLLFNLFEMLGFQDCEKFLQALEIFSKQEQDFYLVKFEAICR